jgi:phage tail-like protein
MAKSAGRETDPLAGYLFRLEFQDEIGGFFSECSGIGSEHEVIEHKVVSDKGEGIIQKIPGRMKWQDVTLKRGITDRMDVWEWRKKVEDGNLKEARKNCSVIMMDRDHKECARWDFVNAWPSKVTGPTPKSDSNEFGVEEMTIVHEGMTRVTA